MNFLSNLTSPVNIDTSPPHTIANNISLIPNTEPVVAVLFMLQTGIPESDHGGQGWKLHTVANSPAWNQTLSDYGVKRERTMWTGGPLVSSRWSPTPEQLQALEELYRHGIRTPSAEQIQQIVARLRRFGRIEGKNVFYWFQNHKAREKQRKRRHMEMLARNKMRDSDTTEQRQSGSRKCLGVDHHRRLYATSPCSTSCKSKQMELQQQHTVTTKCTEAFCPWELSSCMAPDNFTAQKYTGQRNGTVIEIGFNKLSEPDECFVDILCGFKETQTLDLFPIKTKEELNPVAEEETNGISKTEKRLVPNQFFEFLPTKKLDVFTATV